MNNEPKVIKRHGEVGFRGKSVTFNASLQVVVIEADGRGVQMDITDFLNLVEQATWYFDEFASKEER